MLRIALASLHLLALALGLGAVFTRSAALHARPLTARDVKRAFRADSYWGLAAVLWLATGVWRLVAHTEKPMTYYGHNVVFQAKMGGFLLILLLELWPAITLDMPDQVRSILIAIVPAASLAAAAITSIFNPDSRSVRVR